MADPFVIGFLALKQPSEQAYQLLTEYDDTKLVPLMQQMIEQGTITAQDFAVLSRVGASRSAILLTMILKGS